MKAPLYLRLGLCVPLFVAFISACNPSPGEVREWTPADHDQPPRATNASPPGASARGDGSAEAQLVEIAWQKHCLMCHGARGRGDGPQGPMMRAPDLTRAEWQERVTDQEILETIRKGRNRMPAFDLPPQILEGLVKRIRANRQP